MSTLSSANAAQTKYDLNNQAYEWEMHIKDVIGEKHPSMVEGLTTGKYTDTFPDAQLKSQYAKDKHSACMVIKNSLDPSHIESLCNNEKWGKAISGSDPHEMRKIAREELIEPVKDEMRSLCFNRLTKLTLIQVTDIHEVGREIVRTHNRFKYYNDGKDGDEVQHTVWCHNFTKHLGYQFQNFVMAEDAKVSTPKNLVTLTENAMKFAKRYGVYSKPVKTTLQTETEPPSAFRADSNGPNRGGKHGPSNQPPGTTCDRCGASNHHRDQCQATDLWCNTCAQAAKPHKYCSSHSTAAHRGPRRHFQQTGKDRKGPTQQRKDAERKTTFKTQEQSDRQANFLSLTDDSEDEDWNIEPVVFVGGATVATPTREFLHMTDVGETSHAPKDGNCLYHCLGTATGHTMQEMRNLAATYIENNSEREYQETEMTWKARVCMEYDRNMEESLNDMRRSAYGGGLEVAALGHALNRDIAIYEKVSNNQTGEIFGYNLLQGPISHGGDSTAEPIWLLWQRGASEAGNHYDLLLPPRAQTTNVTTTATADANPLPARTYASVVKGTATRTPPVTATKPSRTSVAVAPTQMKTSAPVVAASSTHPIVSTITSVKAFKAASDNNDETTQVARGDTSASHPPQLGDKQQRFYLDSGASEHLFDSSAAVTTRARGPLLSQGSAAQSKRKPGKTQLSDAS